MSVVLCDVPWYDVPWCALACSGVLTCALVSGAYVVWRLLSVALEDKVPQRSWPERVGHARNNSVLQDEWQTRRRRTELERFELLVDDHKRSAHPAVIADYMKIATLARGLHPALGGHVELNHIILNLWIEVTNLFRRDVKTKQFH